MSITEKGNVRNSHYLRDKKQNQGKTYLKGGKGNHSVRKTFPKIGIKI